MVRGLARVLCVGGLVVFVLACSQQPVADSGAAADVDEGSHASGLMQCFDLSAAASSPDDWTAVREVCETAIVQNPDVPALHVAASAAWVNLGNQKAALDHLDVVVELGATTDLDVEPGFAEVLADPAFQGVRARLEANAGPLPPAEVVHRIQDIDFWPEGIARDPDTGDLYLGSIGRRAIYRLSPDGELAQFGDPPNDLLMEVLGLAVDADRRELWAVTGLGEYTEPLEGPPRNNELVRFDLESGRVVQRYSVSEGPLRLLNDVVVGPDGTVWVTETLRGEVYRVRPGGDLELYRRYPELVYLNGIAISDDGRTLYLGHWEGLSAIDLEDGERTPVRGSGMALGMIDGLSFIDNKLVMVQNNRRVRFRVARVDLASDGLRAENLEVLESGVPEGLIPYTCAVGDGSVFVIAGAPFGIMDTEESPAAPAVVKMPLFSMRN